MLKIESPIETSLDSATYSVPTGVIESDFRRLPSVTVIGQINKGNPAFTAWSKRLSYGEKLPRGKFFRNEEIMRTWRTPFKLNGKVKYITVHASQE